jgi:hypothetical protein
LSSYRRVALDTKEEQSPLSVHSGGRAFSLGKDIMRTRIILVTLLLLWVGLIYAQQVAIKDGTTQVTAPVTSDGLKVQQGGSWTMAATLSSLPADPLGTNAYAAATAGVTGSFSA